MLVVPKYKELSVSKIWTKVRESEDLAEYFPDYELDQIPERNYLIGVISTLYPTATRQLIDDARSKRSIKESDKDDMIKITKRMEEELMAVSPQKSNSTLLMFEYSDKRQS
jgi:hypothetical protein